ncbi:MAG: FAD-dependent oxidoreductase [Rhodobacteraceae bacterium]|nr:FAD-dependent oxidoreductase [Paracoccaceae bacterium]
MTQSDVVICGGAVIGSAIAWNLGQIAPKLTVTIIERDPSFQHSSTALSASGIRQQFSDPLNVAIGQFGVGFIKEAPARWGLNLNLHEQGYLYLSNTDSGAQVLRENHAVQHGEGADVTLLSPDELKARFPHLNTDDLTLASLGLSGEGWFDSVGLMQGYQANSNATRLNDKVVGLTMQSGKVAAVQLAAGGEIPCGTFINAAGPYAAEISKMAGIALPVEPRKRTNFTFDCAVPPEGSLPLMIDPSGVWVRPEGQHFLCGCSPEHDPVVGHDDFEPRFQEFEEIIWPALAARSPAFEAIKMQAMWAGHYAYNVLDQNAVTGAHPEIGNFYFANGFSGHGLQQAPAIGRGVAELVALGSYKTLDLSKLGYDRILRGDPLLEKCVI